MSFNNTFFKTGTHHILCNIPNLDATEFPYPRDFQDSWDTDHVRLPCSSYSVSRWSQIVQSMTTPIHNSKELTRLMDQMKEDKDLEGWNTFALEAFLDQKADRPTVIKASESSVTQQLNKDRSPRRDLIFLSMDIDEKGKSGNVANKNAMSGRAHDSDDDIIMNENNFEEEDSVFDEVQDDGYDNNHDNSAIEIEEADFLSKNERERFFKVILPKMQELVLRLPELIKKPIPLLKQQEDLAITLSQEQIACLLANAFFNTFPSRVIPNRRSYTHREREQVDRQGDKNRGMESMNRQPFSEHHESWMRAGNGPSKRYKNTEGRTLNGRPCDPYGSKSNLASKQSGPKVNPLKNSKGQMSLFAYFGRVDPQASATELKPASPRESTISSISPENVDKTLNETNKHYEHLSDKKESLPRYPSINFWSLFNSNEIGRACTPMNAAKLRCIIHYFDRVTTEMPQGTVTFHRQVLESPITLNEAERVSSEAFSYVQVHVDVDNPLEDEAPSGALQLDFANKVIGGGVLGYGAVQEEIRFLICPELITSRLFTLQLQDNEAVLIKGAERYSNYNGYASTFTWHSDFVDTTPRDRLGRRKTEICAIDALPFKSKELRLRQFSRRNILREVNKAIVGFRRSAITASEWGLCRAESPMAKNPPIATGNWGCGAFGGHLQLKFLIQLIAASVCGGYSRDDEDLPMGRDIVYYTYGLDDLAKEIKTFMSKLLSNPQAIEPSVILDVILQYPIRSSRGYIVGLRDQSLLDYVSVALGFSSESSYCAFESSMPTMSSISSFEFS
ncbi:hypothetical protein BX616_011007 [Lobosporangium transversale]|uniref:poly(ADP-ribose) glycohydrolase n=1 Tax=Lobosporangium transversale TaxID=64571 RepID=A0A1Y2GBS6_9FUNG|nr:hypothetical protein BCR41DRAFT_400519 [Lobosporangium transversale]KAF9909962.1 hypothetical protein BX616_011007 [Lobosporangium transversale]ORZ05509.1 hypothetical protein BCR41DRAFT_400519 [Lobosporangium transversale]|eukprot:XP_021877083.1 hypothetical protein BCR41DRAFT_400519 [Lobosporangium transversale]